MPPLRRHQLAYLSAAGWRSVLQHDWDATASACLRHWAGLGLPLVVTRQRGHRQVPGGPVSLGLPAPTCWDRRALALHVDPADVAWLSEFPVLGQALAVLPRSERRPLQALDGQLHGLGVRVHVYGSAGWQHLSGLDYLHARSDLDLWLAVDGLQQADAAVQALARCSGSPRLDGELVFPDGSAVAWREWVLWREGRCAQVLVKRLHSADLEAHPAAVAAGWPCTS